LDPVEDGVFRVRDVVVLKTSCDRVDCKREINLPYWEGS
jgi:hypothetical protein